MCFETSAHNLWMLWLPGADHGDNRLQATCAAFSTLPRMLLQEVVNGETV